MCTYGRYIQINGICININHVWFWLRNAHLVIRTVKLNAGLKSRRLHLVGVVLVLEDMLNCLHTFSLSALILTA